MHGLWSKIVIFVGISDGVERGWGARRHAEPGWEYDGVKWRWRRECEVETRPGRHASWLSLKFFTPERVVKNHLKVLNLFFNLDSRAKPGSVGYCYIKAKPRWLTDWLFTKTQELLNRSQLKLEFSRLGHGC